MTLVRTHYLDWTAPRSQAVLGYMFGDGMIPLARQAWSENLYVAGPWEQDVPRTTEHLAICEALFAKYNADDRPDGQRRRSMSVGDIVQIGGCHYICASLGFQPIEVAA